MTLCNLCIGLNPDVNQYRHHASAADLAASAKSCESCHLFHRLLETKGQLKKAAEYRTTVDGNSELLNDTSITVSTNSHAPPNPDKGAQKPYSLVVSCGPLMRRGLFASNKPEKAPLIRLGMYANEGTGAAQLMDTRPISSDCNNPRTFELIRHWVSTCVEQHDECLLGYMKGETRVSSDTLDGLKKQMRLQSQNDENPLPTRVLDLSAEGQTPSIRLIETSNVRGVYVALSHCWGSSQHLVTTKNTLNDRKKNIAFDDLPRTFRDAVTATRQLGYQFLWIDSLCIVQDDLVDWETESSLMGEIYRNAHLTIAAAASVDGEGGCLGPRVPSSGDAIRLPCRHPQDSADDSAWYVHEERGNYSKSVWQAPLQQRVWTLQERCLSRRIIHFAADQIYFECNRSVRYEDQRPEMKHTSDYVNFSMLYSMTNMRRHTAFQGLMRFLLKRQWIMLLESVMDRKLTKEDDMLPALSGITSHLSQITGIECAAGLLLGECLPDMLLWRVHGYEESPHIRRPQVYRAPSWSWASVAEPVLFAIGGSEPLEPLHNTVVLEHMEVKVKPVGRDSYGRIHSGVLNVTGWLFPVENRGTDHYKDFDDSDYMQCVGFMYRARSYSSPYTPMAGYTYVRTRDQAFWGTAAYDDKGEGLGEVYAILVKEKEEEAKKEEATPSDDDPRIIQHLNSFFVLFVSPTGIQANEYKRVGMGQLVQCVDTDFGAKSSITII